MITLDSSAIIALADRKDPSHREVASALSQETPPYLIPAETLGEVGYFMESALGQKAVLAFLDALIAGDFHCDYDPGRMPRVRELVHQYADGALGLVDAAVAACAEVCGGKVLTLDRRHFLPLANTGCITVLP